MSQYMTKFKRTVGTPYTIITPSTPLAELEDFLKLNLFAIVTDWDRKFVLGVATPQDLEVRTYQRPSQLSSSLTYGAEIRLSPWVLIGDTSVSYHCMYHFLLLSTRTSYVRLQHANPPSLERGRHFNNSWILFVGACTFASQMLHHNEP